VKKISLILPVYNEKDTIEYFINQFLLFFNQTIDQIKYSYELIFINDGSTDQTAEILTQVFHQYEHINVLHFSRNFGKENALFAGLDNAIGDIIIPIDVDLQDPLHVISAMLNKYEEGYDVVLAKRVNRNKDSYLKKKSAELFYNFYNKIAEVKLEPNVGDFRLMDRKVVDEILNLQENQLFMKGLFNWVGFETTVVEYSREERFAGETKFNFFKLWKLAVEGFTSFSTFPLKVWTSLGSLIALFSFIFGFKIIIEKLFFGIDAHGYASLICAITMLGGIQLIGIGVLGEYIGRIYMESKKRPKYIIKKTLKK